MKNLTVPFTLLSLIYAQTAGELYTQNSPQRASLEYPVATSQVAETSQILQTLMVSLADSLQRSWIAYHAGPESDGEAIDLVLNNPSNVYVTGFY